jgi:hypothetical protein
MGEIKRHAPVKLIVGFIFKQEWVFVKAKAILERKFGKIDFESELLDFGHTDYYQKEFGSDLKRKFISFEKLIPAQSLPKIKILTNGIEKRLSRLGLRLVNIDPGYLDPAKICLASTKDYRHRIYLSQGIFAEITLFFQGKTFRAWEWTYPDYGTAEYISIFNRIREIYLRQVRR